MMIDVDLWQLLTFLVGLLVSFVGAAAAMGKLLLAQVERRLDARFAALEHRGEDVTAQWLRVERDLLALRAELPQNYVRREDYIRGQSVIEAKLDGLALKIENRTLRGSP